MIPNTRRHFFSGSSVNGGILAEGIVITDKQGCGLTDVFKILSYLADG